MHYTSIIVHYSMANQKYHNQKKFEDTKGVIRSSKIGRETIANDVHVIVFLKRLIKNCIVYQETKLTTLLAIL